MSVSDLVLGYGADVLCRDARSARRAARRRLRSSREIGPDAAVVHAAWTLTGQITPTGETAGDRSGVLSFTLTRQNDGHWLAVSAQNTDRVPGAQTHLASRLHPRTGKLRAAPAITALRTVLSTARIARRRAHLVA